jgi:hypothetical protein
MTDLVLQGFENISNERLDQELSNEKREMLGEERVPAKKWAFNWLSLSSFADLVSTARKERGKKCYEVKSWWRKLHTPSHHGEGRGRCW